jgi:phospholipid-binding lipoprotein MlaA
MMKLIAKFFILGVLFLTASVSARSIPEYSYSELYSYDNQDIEKDPSQKEQDSISDPFYVLNKNIFNINYLLDRAFFSPIAETYLAVVPKRGRIHIGNFLSNMGEPINFINMILQGNFKQAKISVGRFLTNTVLGCFGFLDVAKELSLKYRGEDFGRTLAHYGASSGPYLVIPLLGPTSVRDVSGKVADFFIDPFKYTLHKEHRNIINAAWLLHKRSELSDVIKTVNRSLDPYETAKMLYIQNRASRTDNKQ